jgi:hypothetical protein
VLEELVHFCLLFVSALNLRLAALGLAALNLAALDDVDHAPDQASNKATKPCKQAIDRQGDPMAQTSKLPVAWRDCALR